jgi:hypothetical protein
VDGDVVQFNNSHHTFSAGWPTRSRKAASSAKNFSNNPRLLAQHCAGFVLPHPDAVQ